MQQIDYVRRWLRPHPNIRRGVHFKMGLLGAKQIVEEFDALDAENDRLAKRVLELEADLSKERISRITRDWVWAQSLVNRSTAKSFVSITGA